jgi:diguanylate cyclase (GGDEF)-like protein
MAQAIKTARRTRHIVAVLFLDLDFFKTVNDTHGHPVGDQLLKLVATRLKGLLRLEDTVARVGGDEFVILLANLTSEVQAITMAEKVVKVLTDSFQVEGQRLSIGVSVGVSLYPEHDVNEKNLIKMADNAMYAAKRQGRNCYALYRDKLLGQGD